MIYALFGTGGRAGSDFRTSRPAVSGAQPAPGHSSSRSFGFRHVDPGRLAADLPVHPTVRLSFPIWTATVCPSTARRQVREDDAELFYGRAMSGGVCT